MAKDQGIFADHGLDVEFYTVNRDELEPADKVAWYSDLVKAEKLDAYSVCAWGAIDRLAGNDREKIIAASTSSAYAFSIVADTRNGIRVIEDLAGYLVLVRQARQDQLVGLVLLRLLRSAGARIQLQLVEEDRPHLTG